ncbi:MAG: DUF4838 domain-containing protein [Limnochordia bacterium]
MRAWQRVTPVPRDVRLENERIRLDNQWSLQVPLEWRQAGEQWVKTFGLAGDPRDRVVSLNYREMATGEYELKIGTDRLDVTAGDEVGLQYALQTLWQLSPDGEIPLGEITDGPALKMRGFHVNFDSFRQMDFDEAAYVLRHAAQLKLNTILLEYSDRFPFDKHSLIQAPTALAREQVKQLVNSATENHLEIIPLQQSIGHLAYLLKHDAYSHLREEETHRDQWCPLHPGSFQVWTELVEEIIALHPSMRYLHVGGDEARRLGQCPKCREKVEKYGVSRLYIDYMNQVIAWLAERNLTPIIWDDMLCAHPEALDDLDRRLVIMYWEYWTTSKSSPYFIARYDRAGKPVTVCDERWKTEWASELTDLERDVMGRFVRGVPLEESLGPKFMRLYGPYLGPEFPKRIKGYPYLEFYRDQGFKVIAAPTTLGNGDNYHSLPNYWRFVPNIRTACERAREAGVEGVVTTAWYNYTPLMFHLGLATTAQFAWGAVEPAP